MKLMWTNKFSGEQGFVKAIKTSKGHFENTYNEAEARNFRSSREAEKAIEQLVAIGETENNRFEII